MFALIYDVLVTCEVYKGVLYMIVFECISASIVPLRLFASVK